ncbi:MAG: hypothetical protein WD055_02070 [Candidatus Dependentiae bacterium]
MNKLFLALSLVCIAGNISAADTEKSKKRMTREERAALALQKAMDAKERGKRKTYKKSIESSAKLERPTAILFVAQDKTKKKEQKLSSRTMKRYIKRLERAVNNPRASEGTKKGCSILLADLYNELSKKDKKLISKAHEWKQKATGLQMEQLDETKVAETLEKNPNEYTLEEADALDFEQFVLVMKAQINQK